MSPQQPSCEEGFLLKRKPAGEVGLPETTSLEADLSACAEGSGNLCPGSPGPSPAPTQVRCDPAGVAPGNYCCAECLNVTDEPTRSSVPLLHAGQD